MLIEKIHTLNSGSFLLPPALSKFRVASAFGVIALATGAVFASDFDIDFHQKFKEVQSETLFAAEKYEEARELFEELAETVASPEATAMWRARAAVAFGLQDDRFDDGIAMAKAVASRPYSIQAQMALMASQRDDAGLIETFGEEDIASWPPLPMPRAPRYPETDIRCIALYDRGVAFHRTGNGSAAERDLEKAAEFADGPRRKLEIWRELATTQVQLLKDEEKAFQANLNIARLGSGGASYYRGVIAAATYLREQGRYDEALAVLDKMQPCNLRGYWFSLSVQAVGRTLAAAGRTEEAVAAYRKILEDRDIRERVRHSVLLDLGPALAAAGQTEEAALVFRQLIAEETASKLDKNAAQAALDQLEQKAE